MEIIRGLIDEIVLVPEDTDLRIDLTDELSGILAVVSESEKRTAELLEERGIVRRPGFWDGWILIK